VGVAVEMVGGDVVGARQTDFQMVAAGGSEADVRGGFNFRHFILGQWMIGEQIGSGRPWRYTAGVIRGLGCRVCSNYSYEQCDWTRDELK
jgi:hypothetical protein